MSMRPRLYPVTSTADTDDLYEQYTRTPVHPLLHRVTPAELALSGYTHRWVYARGLRFHVALAHSTRTTEKESPLILCLHDAYTAWFDFRHLAGYLAAEGYTIAMPDLRGFGMSDKPPRDETLRAYTGDVLGIIHELGYDTAIILGQGTGGAIGWCFAAQYADATCALISIASAHPQLLRTQALRRPWLYLTPWTRYGMTFLPQKLKRMVMPRFRHRAALSIMNNIDHHAHNTCIDIAEETRLRRLGLGITATESFRRKVIRFSLENPGSFAELPVEVPAVLIQDASKPWRILAQREHKMAQQSRFYVHIPGTKNLPHLEKPEETAQEILSALQHIFSNKF